MTEANKDAAAPKRKRIGWLWYVAVLVAVLGMSWGGPLFALLGKETPPFMKAGWRLQLMVLTMAPMAWWQWRQSSPELRARWRSKLGVLALNGAVFAVHLCSFAWAIDHTSFSHAMIIVATLPMLLVTWAALLFLAYRSSEAQQHASSGVAVEGSVGTGGETAPTAAEGLSLAVSSSQVVVDTTALNTNPDASAGSLPGAIEGTTASTTTANPTGVPPIVKPLKTQVSLSSAAKAASMPRRRTGSASLAGGESGVAIVLEDYEETLPRVVNKGSALPPVGGDSEAPSPLEPAPSAPDAPQPAPAPAPETRLHQFVRFARGGDPSPPLPPTRQEAIGSVVAFIGLALLVSGKSGSDSGSSSVGGTATLAGDLMALITALTMAIYVLVGQSIRRWMPTWMYAAPLMASSCVTAIILSLIFEEGTSFFSAGPRGAFGYFGTGRDFGITTAAAIVPGILGHGIANLALARINPLVLSVVQLIQPGISVMEGSAIGVQKDLPEGVFFSAPIIFFGIFLVVTGSRNAPKVGRRGLPQLRAARAALLAVAPCLKKRAGNSTVGAIAGAKLTKLEGSG